MKMKMIRDFFNFDATLYEKSVHTVRFGHFLWASRV